MKKTIYLLLISVSVFSTLHAQTILWANTGGGAADDESYCPALDNAGNVYITGIFSGPALIASANLTSGGGSDMFTAKYTVAGFSVWAQTGSGFGNSGGHVLAVDASNNIYVAGEFEDTLTIGTATLISAGASDIFLARYNSAGTLQWAVRAGGTGLDAASSIGTDGGGNIYLTGHFENTFTFGTQSVTSAGGKDLYAARIDDTGTIVWLTRAGGLADDESRGIAVDVSGSSCIAGHIDSNATFGSFNLINVSGSKDVFAARLDAGGVFQWAVPGGGNGDDDAYEAAMDNAGNCYVAGYFHDTASFGSNVMFSNGRDDAFIVKYNSAGVVQWARQAGDTLGDRIYAISSDAAGNIVVTGSFEDTVTFGTTTLISSGDKDVFVAEYNSAGTIQWAVRAGGAGFDRGYGIINDNAGSIYVTGVYEQSADFGSNLLNSAGLRDLFLVKISSPTGTQENLLSENIFSVYPNPANHSVSVVCSLPQDETSSFVLFNVMGEKIISENITDKIVIDISACAGGIYFYRIVSKQNMETGKLVVR
ncbi:MAG TPA: T9SS type A sorting domain-containing protein [Bacteroidia bacterium]|nr:T9SS type A sorting domain-containing protein [Bacteroidia bacterium]